MHKISENIDGGATEADGGASAPVGPSVAMPLLTTSYILQQKHTITFLKDFSKIIINCMH